MVERKPSKLHTRVRFPSPAPFLMHGKSVSNFLALFAALSFSIVALRADNGWDHSIVTLTEENDSGLSDRHYTQGAQFSFLSHDHDANDFTRCLPSLRYDALRWKYGIEGGHLMFTPENIA